MATLTDAIDVYDGPLYQALRRRRDSGTLASISVKIISAKYGLISSETKISTYDRRLDPERDHTLIQRARRELQTFLERYPPESICISLGKDYRLALPPLGPSAVFVSGPPGARVRQVLNWIECK